MLSFWVQLSQKYDSKLNYWPKEQLQSYRSTWSFYESVLLNKDFWMVALVIWCSCNSRKTKECECWHGLSWVTPPFPGFYTRHLGLFHVATVGQILTWTLSFRCPTFTERFVERIDTSWTNLSWHRHVKGDHSMPLVVLHWTLVNYILTSTSRDINTYHGVKYVTEAESWSVWILFNTAWYTKYDIIRYIKTRSIYL